MADPDHLRQAQEAGVAWLQQLFGFQNLSLDITAQQVEDEAGNSCWLTLDHSTLSPEQIQILQGEHGEVLDALQYLANTTLNLGRSQAEQQAYTVELAGYRAQRQEELKQLAAAAAAQVLETAAEYEMEPLSAAERRQMHHLLKGYEGIESFSRGKEPDRRLVVRPISPTSPEEI